MPWHRRQGCPGLRRVRHLTGRNRGVNLERMITDLNPLLRGWDGYFGLSQLRELPSLGWVGDAFAAPPGSNVSVSRWPPTDAVRDGAMSPVPDEVGLVSTIR
jgi:Group II intron, maturase-specific domain